MTCTHPPSMLRSQRKPDLAIRIPNALPAQRCCHWSPRHCRLRLLLPTAVPDTLHNSRPRDDATAVPVHIQAPDTCVSGTPMYHLGKYMPKSWPCTAVHSAKSNRHCDVLERARQIVAEVAAIDYCRCRQRSADATELPQQRATNVRNAEMIVRSHGNRYLIRICHPATDQLAVSRHNADNIPRARVAAY